MSRSQFLSHRHRRWWIGDGAVLPMLSAIAYFIQARTYTAHNWIAISWGDWAAHAYRARFLATWGLTTWTPDWDAGLPLFQGYQTIPHVLTAALASVTGAEIPRVMMLLTALLVVLYPLSGYIVLRLLGLGVPGALLGAVLLLDNPDIALPIRDFSNLFGIALVPVLAWVVLRALGTRAGYLGAVILGLSPEFHPYATVAAAALLLVRLAHEHSISRRLVVQLGIGTAVASCYWLPFMISARPAFQDPWGSSTALQHAEFGPEGLGGVSLAMYVLTGACLVLLALRRIANRRLVICGLGGAALLGWAAALAYWGRLPDQVMETAPVRWMPYACTLAALGIAPVGDEVARAIHSAQWSTRRWRQIAATMVAGAALVAILFEGAFWYSGSYIPTSETIVAGGDLSSWIDSHPEVPRPLTMWAAPNDIAFISYAAFGQTHFTGDYIVGREWTLTAPQLVKLIMDDGADAPASTGDFSGIEHYLRMYGVQYLYLDDATPTTPSFITGPLRGHLDPVQKTSNGWILRVPWMPVQAFVADLKTLRGTTLPDVRYLTPDEIRLRDQRVAAYDDVAYSPEAGATTALTWESPTTLRVATGVPRPGQALVIPQNWDTAWTATSAGRSLGVERIGPNFIAVHLDGLSGRVLIEVRHGVPAPWIIAGVATLVGTAVAAALTIVDRSPRTE